MTRARAETPPSEPPAGPVAEDNGGADSAPPAADRSPGQGADPQTGGDPAAGAPTDTDQSTGDLIKQLSEQTSTLIRQELRLAQVELREKGKKAGLGAGLFGAGGAVAFFALGALIAAAVVALSTALAAWLSALIVAAVLLAGAGVAALMGKKQVEEATPPAPEGAVESVKRDVETVKRSASR